MALYLEEKRQPNLPRRGLDPGWSGLWAYIHTLDQRSQLILLDV